MIHCQFIVEDGSASEFYFEFIGNLLALTEAYSDSVRLLDRIFVAHVNEVNDPDTRDGGPAN